MEPRTGDMEPRDTGRDPVLGMAHPDMGSGISQDTGQGYLIGRMGSGILDFIGSVIRRFTGRKVSVHANDYGRGSALPLFLVFHIATSLPRFSP